MLSILICILFNVMMKLILIIHLLLPLISGNTLLIFSKSGMILFLFFVDMLYFLVSLNFNLLR